MNHERDRLEENNIVSEIESSFIEYSMSVIASRAFARLKGWLKTCSSSYFIFNA